MGNACCKSNIVTTQNEFLTQSNHQDIDKFIKFGELISTVPQITIKDPKFNLEQSIIQDENEWLDENIRDSQSNLFFEYQTIPYTSKGENHRLIQEYILYPDSQDFITQSQNFHERKQLPALQLVNGSIYNGEWMLGMKDGYGVLNWPDGSSYEGQFKDDAPYGHGTIKHQSGDLYIGQWVCGQQHGYGIFHGIDGRVYEGQWENDKQHGKGVEKWPNGQIYRGSYLNGEINGEGNLNLADGGKYNGEFSKGKLDGQGQYFYPDGKVYKGQWKQGQMHGYGVMIWPDGRKYIGNYYEDKKQGLGSFYWRDGRVYQGYWLDGKQNGFGIYTNEHDITKIGEWEQGKRLRWLQQKEYQQLLKGGTLPQCNLQVTFS